MGYFSDSLDFEKFFAKDLWKGIKKDPKRLVLGVDPASTWAWNKVLGRDDDPLVDQMGGPYDGRVFSFGHGDGGVYDRAQAAGINTKSASMNHDAAHLIAGAYGAAGLGGAFGGGAGGGSSGANPGLWDQGFAGTQGFSGAPYGSNPAAGISGIGGPVGGGTGASSAAGLGAMDYAKLGMGVMNAAQPQQQQQTAPPPQQKPSRGQQLTQSINGGLGRVANGLFPVDPRVAAGMDPAYLKQMQNNALLQMGLGMAAAAGKPGATFAQAFGAGLGNASTDLEGAMQTAYQNARAARADKRAENREDRDMQREDRLDRRQQWLEDHTLEREKTQDDRYKSEQDYRLKQAEQAQKRWEFEQSAMAQWRKDQLEAQQTAKLPVGYEPDPNNPGGYRYIKGGPADPSVSNARNAGNPTEDERKAAGYAVRLENAMNLWDSIAAQSPGAQKPNIGAAAAEKIPLVGDVVANSMNAQERQRFEAAQRDAIDAALTLATGAAYTKQQFEDTKKSLFPQIGDDPKTLAEKKLRLQSIIQTARIRAGRAGGTINQAVGSGGFSPEALQGGLGSPMQGPSGMQIYPNSQSTSPDQQRAIAERAGSYY